MINLKVIALLLVLGTCSLRAGELPLNGASPYNLFAIGQLDANGNLVGGTIRDNADINGRIAAAGSISGSLTVGSSIVDPYGSAAPFDVLAQGGITAGTNINLNSSGNVYAPGTDGNINFNGGGSRVTDGSSGVDFNTVRSYLDSYSTYLASLSANGTVGMTVDTHNPNWTALTGTDSALDVFSLTAEQFGSGTFDLVAPAGATVLVNVSGQDVTGAGGGLFINGQQFAGDSTGGNHVLFNFFGATDVSIDEQFAASVLAPYATFTSGSQVDGNIIAASIGQTGEVHDPLFEGSNLPVLMPAPEPISLGLMSVGLAAVSLVGRRRLKQIKFAKQTRGW